MASDSLVIQTKLIPPRPRRPSLSRPRLSEQILRCLDHRITIVQAATGYGKSTALVQALGEGRVPLLWYSVAETDSDPVVFLLHVIHSMHLQLPASAENALAYLRQGASGGPAVWRRATDMLINEVAENLTTESVLVIDDFHLVRESEQIAEIVTQLTNHLPANVHLVLSTRQRPALEELNRWDVKGQLLKIGTAELAFTPEEIEALFRTQYGLRLSPADVEKIWNETEGWVIALQMIWKALESGSGRSVGEVCATLPQTLDPLFEYLGKEVLSRLPPDRQRFFLTTSVLRSLTPEVCDALLEWHGSEAYLRTLCDDGLFLQPVGPRVYRYQHLFQDFLQGQLQAYGLSISELHRKAARFYEESGPLEEAVSHDLAANEVVHAAELIERLADRMVRTGRLDTLRGWILSLPRALLEEYPQLMVWMGDTHRLASRFDEALDWYTLAEARYRALSDNAGLSRALRSQGTVYLDTVRPLRAEALLEEALRLNDEKDRRDRAALLQMLAENRTNQGRLDEAQVLRQQARDLLAGDGPSITELDVRVLLRTGRIDQAQALLEQRAAQERLLLPHRPARAHRETLLILSLIYAFQGKPGDAYRCAQEGLAVGRALASPFVEAVGYMRLGHALQIGQSKPAESEQCYLKSIEIAESLDVTRVKVEPLWGLTRLYGYFGDLSRAEVCAREGIDIGLAAGDEWIAALARLALGSSYALAGRKSEAVEHLLRAEAAFMNCSDPFARAAARLWLSLLHLDSNDPAAFSLHTNLLLNLAQEDGCACLLTAPSLLGPPDPQRCVPLLMSARRQRIHSAYATSILRHLRLEEFDTHPGYSLRIKTLGLLQVWRGRAEIAARDWQREKARQLFALFLVHRGQLLQREQIMEYLWRDVDPSSAEAGFKVALNALVQAVEPTRPSRSTGFFIVRRESAYGLNPAAVLHVDSDEFQELLARADDLTGSADESIRLLTEALSLYHDDYMSEFLYEDWALRERERLRQLYVSAATQLASLLADKADWGAAIAWCERALARDNCWEEAYRILMRCHDAQGNRALVARTYEQCEKILGAEVDTAPMPETMRLYRQLMGS